jgi:peroxisomal 2,4-dienoyl-CoA reductase
MRASGGGCIVNISMTLHYRGWPQMAHATAAKGGIDALTRTLAIEWAPDNVRVNAVVFLASPAASWVTGAILVVDGGEWLARSAP